MIRFPFSRRYENILVVNATPKGFSAALFSVSADKEVAVKAVWPKVDPYKVRCLAVKNSTVIAADASLAATVEIPLSFRTAGAKEPLSLIELENFLARAVGKAWSDCRHRVAKFLGADELEVVLARNRVGRFTVDGRSVHDPVGVVGRRFNMVLELTLARRGTLEALRYFFRAARRFLFTECWRSELRMFERAAGFPVNVAAVGAERTVLCARGATGAARVKEIPWGMERVVGAVTSLYGVSRRVALGLYARYVQGLLSPAFTNFLSGALAPIFDDLRRKINSSKLRGTVLVDTVLPFPQVALRPSTGVVFGIATVDFLFKELGFTIKESRRWREIRQPLEYIVPLLDFYYAAAESPVGQNLHRRLQWLSL